MKIKLGAIVLNNDKLLVVREKDENIYIMPGGGIKKGETHEQCLARELKEEVGVGAIKFRFFGTFVEPAIFEKGKVSMSVYFVDIEGVPKPRSEITECLWLGKNYRDEKIRCGSVLEKHIIPKLIDMGLLK